MSNEQKEVYLEDLQDSIKKKVLTYGQLLQMAKYLEGRVLTICDASLDVNKAKASKDLVRDAFRTFRLEVERVVENDGDEFTASVLLADTEIIEDGLMKFTQPQA